MKFAKALSDSCRHHLLGSFIVLIVVVAAVAVSAQQPAFPGAQGFGKYTTGGRGGTVIEVTNLNDSGSGSLRRAINTSGRRTVVFRVSGTIHLKSTLTIGVGNITIAGQTAPGDGICIADHMLRIDADNVIIRYLRFRLGDVYKTEDDAMFGRERKDIIIDHCSMSWSIDETGSFYDNENFTLQWSLLSESLYDSYHPKGTHGYGGIWGGMGASFHHNLLAHHSSRNPRFNGSRYHGMPAREIVDFRNNVIYNWGGNSAYGGEAGNQNLVANYYKAGPATSRGEVQHRIVNPSDLLGHWYVADNFVFGYPDVTADNWAGGVQPTTAEDEIRVDEPYPVTPILTQTAQNAFKSVLADVGAVRPKRDSLDERIVREARTGTATYGGSYGANRGIIDTQETVGGWPELQSAEPPVDDDHDGMADEWELAHGLNPADPEDRNGDMNGDGYTNLETYMNSLCLRDDYLVPPAELTGATVSSSEIQLSWKEITPDETGFVIERSASDTTNFIEVATTAANDTSFLDSGLDAGTIYFYRIKAKNATTASFYANYAATKTLYPGNAPLEPTEPNPANDAQNVEIVSTLNWDPAIAATSYDVYFSTSNPPDFVQNQVETVYDPRGLADSTTYYWRVDAVNENGTTTGNIWSFTTAPFEALNVAAWSFDRGRGVLALDETGNRNHIRLQNMGDENWIDGLSGTALSFDGVEEYLQMDDSDWMNFSIRGFTVNFFVKQSTNPSPWLNKMEGNGRGYELGHDSENIRFHLSDGETSATLLAPSADFPENKWVMITAVRDRDAGELLIYQDGTLLATTPDNTWNITNDADVYWARSSDQSEFYNGALDEASVYNYALSADDIRALYENYMTDVQQHTDAKIPRELSLVSYPNPFNNRTILTYTVPVQNHVNIAVYNALGQQVDLLVDEEKSAGRHSFGYETSHLSSSVYIVRIQSGDQTSAKKILLIR